jgi:hypothetical protein
MEPVGSLPYSQMPTTFPYPEPTPSSPHNPLQRPEDPYEYLRLGLPNGLFSSVSPTNTLCNPVWSYIPLKYLILDVLYAF